MLFNQQNGSNLEVVGGKVYDTTIDAKDIEVVTTLLSSNLYSEPEKSFIREIVSNAWDSEVEAGTTDMPVLVKFTKNKRHNLTSVTIRDYGTGISKERMENVFIKIGSSTKRTSNDFIGCFGIGRFSALAVSDMITIISYYKGMAYTYVMTKDGNKIQTVLLNEASTMERNGVEYRVSIKNPCDTTDNKYRRALESIIFFPNIYVEGCENLRYHIRNINTIKIKEYKYFKFASVPVGDQVLLGNVLYPLNINAIEYDDISNGDMNAMVHRLSNTGFVFKFNIGEIEVTPNRESIIYTDKTVKVIRQRIKNAMNEIEDAAEKAVTKDYTDFEEYARAVNSYVYWVPIDDKVVFSDEKIWSGMNGYEFYNKDMTKMLPLPVTYRGKNYSKYTNLWTLIKKGTLPGLIGISLNNKFIKEGIRSSYIARNFVKNFNSNVRKIVAVPAETRFTSVKKAYLSSMYSECPVVRQMTKKEFADNIFIDDAESKLYQDNDDTRFILSEFYDWLQKKVVHEDFNDKEYVAFVDRRSVYDAGQKVYSGRISYTVYSSPSSRDNKTVDNITELYKRIKECQRTIILGSVKDDSVLWGYVAMDWKRTMYLTTNKFVRENILAQKFSNVMTQKEWINGHLWEIKVCKTLHDYIKQQWDYDENGYYNFKRTLQILVNFANENEESVYRTMNKFLPFSNRSSCFMRLADKLETEPDEKLGKLFKKVEFQVRELRKVLQELSDFRANIIENSDPMVYIAILILMRRKIFRPSKKALEVIHNNNIVKLLKLK